MLSNFYLIDFIIYKMKRPYQFLHLALLFLLLTSATFSQSGAAKSLEIGNQWVYYYKLQSPTLNHLIL